ncbi:MAG TPA: PaaI family thioesterase [Pyrinomonadaceae bacterium]|nr:PaaI family thioesterase [Pyrinomonadaceae bacterium]
MTEKDSTSESVKKNDATNDVDASRAESSTSPDASGGRASGLEYFQKLMRGEVPRSPMSELIGFRIVEVERGRAVLELDANERFNNGLGIAHGGLAATLLDAALGCAVNTVMPAGKVFTTLEMKVNYVRPMNARTGTVRCEARVVHAGSRTATASGRITDAAGKLYAHGTATCMLFRQ